jgi:hypothetical protein
MRGDGWVPGLTGGDHCVQVPQDRGGDDRLGLCRLELVVLPGGQVAVAGAVDGVGSLLEAPRRVDQAAAAGSNRCRVSAVEATVYMTRRV